MRAERSAASGVLFHSDQMPGAPWKSSAQTCSRREKFTERQMANASKKSIGAGAQGKGTGTGAMTEVPKELLGENQVLSNRDKKQHSDARGQDSKTVQN